MPFQPLPFSKRAQSRVIKQQSTATIQHLIDAVVELSTNCDDSYCRLENEGKHPSGKIEIYVSREKGGKCKEFKIRDCAEGMNKEKLESKAIGYGEESSGFTEGKTVRGLLGRGLKESIIGLGEGEIYTKKEGVRHGVKIYEKQGVIGYDFIDIDQLDTNKTDSHIIEFLSSEGNGTLVKIKVKNEKIKIPEGDKFEVQIKNHYALRDINSSENREVLLTLEDFGRKRIKHTSLIKFIHPQKEELIFDDTLSLPGYKSLIQLKIWESSEPLFFQRYDPSSIAGIVIKTKGAILDNKLFKYENEPAAFYFRGEAYCEDIANRLSKLAQEGRESEIIDLSRKGLNWRSDYCSAIQKNIEKSLFPLIQKKKKALEFGEKREISHRTKEMLRNVSKLLDKLARQEFKEWEGPQEPKELKIESLVIIPTKANIELNEPRTLSIYAPEKLVKTAGVKTVVISESSDIKIILPRTKRLTSYLELNLKEHPKHRGVYYNFFKVRGREMGKETYISCRLGNQEATTLVIVKQPIKRRKTKGGFISNIEQDSIANPIQRVEYEEKTGLIKIYVKFPGVARYFPSGLKEIEQKEESKVMLAELIGETFCKTLANRKLETGEISAPPGGEIDAFNSTVNEFQKKYLDKIHEIILNWKFK